MLAAFVCRSRSWHGCAGWADLLDHVDRSRRTAGADDPARCDLLGDDFAGCGQPEMFPPGT